MQLIFSCILETLRYKGFIGSIEAELNEDYIAHCKENGIPLHKSYSGSFNIRIPAELHARAAVMAQELGISLNAFVRESLAKAVLN